MKDVIRYSEAFKMQVVRELEERKIETIEEAKRVYGIRGAVTVRRWIEKYGKGYLLKKVVRVEKVEEQNEKQKLKKRVRQLEKALADAHIDQKISEAYTQIACEVAGIKDIEAFKKKHDQERRT